MDNQSETIDIGVGSSGFSNLRESYGFDQPKNIDEKEYNAFLSEYLPVMARRTKRWGSMFDNINHNQLRSQGYFENQKLKRFVRKGIPPTLRPKLWTLFTGVAEKVQDYPNEFSRLCNKKLPDETEYAINLDLNRTFPDNQFFQNLKGESTKKQLTLILHAIAVKHPDIGYCQGLNYLSGMLLLVLKSPDEAFWLLDKMLFELPEYYCSEMRGLKVDILVLNELIRMRSPQICEWFKKHEFDLLMVTSKWFLCWFMETLPIETVLRIWDCLFHEGQKILFRVALTLILMNREKIMRCKRVISKN